MVAVLLIRDSLAGGTPVPDAVCFPLASSGTILEFAFAHLFSDGIKMK